MSLYYSEYSHAPIRFVDCSVADVVLWRLGIVCCQNVSARQEFIVHAPRLIVCLAY